MAERLGVVLYYLGCGVAFLAVAGFLYVLIDATGDGRTLGLIFFGAVGFIAWLFGRICLYILAGE